MEVLLSKAEKHIKDFQRRKFGYHGSNVRRRSVVTLTQKEIKS